MFHSFRSLCVMTLRSCLWITAVLLIDVCCSDSSSCSCPPTTDFCLQNQSNIWVIKDNYTGVIWLNQSSGDYTSKMCIIATNNTVNNNSSFLVTETSTMHTLRLKKIYASRPDLELTIFKGLNCSSFPSLAVMGTAGTCQNTSVKPRSICNGNVQFDSFSCRDQPNDTFIVNITYEGKNASCITCDPAGLPSTTVEQPPLSSNCSVINSTAAKEAMDNLSDIVSKMENESTVAVSMGEVKGILSVISKDEQNAKFVLTSKNSFGKPGKGADTNNDFSASFIIPNDALKLARQAMNVVYVGVFHFPSFTPGTQTAHCSSWDSQGNSPVWTTDGCETTTNNGTITCCCNHLTFFAILMTTEDKLILSSKDLQSLTYITYIGCGMSMFFLGVALFMHFLLRRTKASKSTRILINLFLAMFLLNLTFLSNEWVANIKNNFSCIFIAMATHYFMLSTITWFAIEAFQLYLQLIKVFNIDIRHYMAIILITGWAMPFVAPLGIVISGNYGNLTIYANGTTAHMCWIRNNTVEYIVNIGYYAVVFLFTSIIFIAVLKRIVYLKSAKVGSPSQRSITKELFTVLGLCALLGITWGFAFFSYGPLRIPSYYIFTILNSFQGFFLFLYYYNTAKVIGDKPNLATTTSTSRSASQNTMHQTKSNLG
uniref:Adhesion G protein-coupled receptor G3-like n=1 Tax=Scleropages formosus TaxID=113540 RepID=A0A8C9TZA0_SCLFO